MSNLPDIGILAKTMKRQAKRGTWDGKQPTPYFHACRHVIYPIGLQAIFTRDVGYHTSGWWKNPDYEQCLHLSISFFDPETHEHAPRNRSLTALLLDALFGTDKRYLWTEPPYSDHGKKHDVWHYRLFCGPNWFPILPRGEVYSRELTEAGWKSWSEVQAELTEEVK